MTLFWIIAAAMIAAALALLAPTLLRAHAARDDATEQFNVEIAREHLADITRRRDAGELSDEEYKQERADIEIALAEDLEGTARPAPKAQGGGRWALVAAALLIPAITVPVYLQIGSPQLIEGLPAPQAAAGHGAAGELPPLDELVTRLRERMEANPENAEGWFLLGRTYMRLENYPDAVYAFEKVVALLPEEPAGMLSLADAMTMRDGRRVGDRAIELLQRALTLDPNSVTALWLLGSAAAEKGDNAKALDYWQRAYPLLDQEPGMQTELGQLITRAGGTPPQSMAQLPPIMGATPPMASPPAATNDAPATTAAAADGGAAVTVEVALAPSLMEQTTPEDTVFVLARAESGPPMPLAVARHRVAELPLRVTLTDAMAMMPAMRLSAFPRVKVSAKVSKSGNAGTQPGDLLAEDKIVEPATTTDSIQLLIDHVAQ
ncbi:MAG: c-type cytochrome biogenesis protein CcmI [Gammaproteobacteria bacterium]|nr:c-type cytochrome biogenesis protein CcmI [Gammaproteobacteria bacterium]